MCAVAYVGFKPKRSGEAKSEANSLLYETVARRYTVEMFAVTDNPGDGPKTVLSSVLMPQVGGTYNFGVTEVDSIATIVDVKVESTDNPFIWDVHVEYDTSRVVSAITNNPLNQPAEIRYTTTTIDRPLTRDALGRPVRFSNTRPMDPPIITERRIELASITRNEATYDGTVARAYRGAVNHATYNGLPAYCCRLMDWQASRVFTNGLLYYQSQYDLEVKWDSFAEYVLDQDYMELDPARNGKLTQFRDPVDNNPLGSPSLLNGRGRSRLIAKSRLGAGMTASLTNTTVTLPSADAALFPPGPSAGPEHTTFDIRIDDEVMTVTAGWNTGSWTVLRAQAGTILAAHTAGADITLEPYYLRYLPCRTANFTSLSLPAF